VGKGFPKTRKIRTPSLVFLFTEGKIRNQDRKKSNKRNSFSFQLLNVFSGRNEISVDEFALKLYGVPLVVLIFARIPFYEFIASTKKFLTR
jgi:hypothetical protein